MLLKDPNFKAEKIICACNIIYKDKILLLLRNGDKPQGNTYGVPAGKVKRSENPKEAAVREIKEETGIEVKDIELEYKKTFQVSYEDYNFEFYLYHLYLIKKPKVYIDKKEHKGYRWERPEDAIKLGLIEDEDNVLREIFNLS